jgi:hypothetical protein
MNAAIPPFSEQAQARQAALDGKRKRGEPIGFLDLAGALEPNPDLPDCQSWDIDSAVQCSLPNHHEGAHRAEVTW